MTMLFDRHLRWAMLLPALLVLLVLTVYATLNLVAMSVSTIDFVGGREIWSFTPWLNLSKLRADQIFRVSLVNTFVFVVLSVTLEMAIGFALALLVSSVPRMKGIVRTVMIVPILMPPVAIGSIWKLLYNYDFGIFNLALATVRLPLVDWLGNPHLALLSIVLVDVWHWAPFVFLILLAAVEALPRELIEAARVDGAGSWTLVTRIIAPLLMPALTVAFLFRSIGAFKMFDQVYLLTSGGPGTATEVVTLHLYKVFFAQNELGYGSMLSLAIIAAVAAFLVTTRGARAGVRGAHA